MAATMTSEPRLTPQHARLRLKGRRFVVDVDRVRPAGAEVAPEVEAELVGAVDHRAGHFTGGHRVQHTNGEGVARPADRVRLALRASAGQPCLDVERHLRWARV